mgnify:CR=1 FL=1
MLNARAILRLLIDDEQPVPPPPDDPNQLGLDFNADDFNAQDELLRYAEQPFSVPGAGPTDLYQRLDGKLRRPTKKVANNTYLIRHDDRLAVRFHLTEIVTAYPDGRVVVNSGGWKPGGYQQAPGWRMEPGTTTMSRMNDWLCSGWRIYKLKHEWFWYNNGQNPWDSEVRFPYSDLDYIQPDGSLHTQQHPTTIKRRRKRV